NGYRHLLTRRQAAIRWTEANPWYSTAGCRPVQISFSFLIATQYESTGPTFLVGAVRIGIDMRLAHFEHWRQHTTPRHLDGIGRTGEAEFTVLTITVGHKDAY